MYQIDPVYTRKDIMWLIRPG